MTVCRTALPTSTKNSGHVLTACVRNDDASAWHVRQSAGGQWRWVAWSDWTRFNRGLAPEVMGLSEERSLAIELATSAARSMNPVRSLQVYATEPRAVRQAI